MNIGNLEVYGIIYKITNTIDGKKYIGQTTQKRGFNSRYRGKGIGIERVYKHHLYAETNNVGSYNKHLLNSIKKYGFEAFKVDEIFDIAFSKEELDIKEQCWISYYCSDNSLYGYNQNSGGKNNKRSIDSLSKISREVICLNDGNIFMNGRICGEFYNIPEPTIYRLCRIKKPNENNKLFFLYVDEYILLSQNEIDDILKYTYHRINDNPLNVKVICLNTLETFNSVSIASRHLNILEGGISAVLCGRSKYTIYEGKKLVWEYYDKYLLMTQEEINNKIKDSNTYRGKGKKVICLTTLETFKSITDASRKYKNAYAGNIYKNMSGAYKYAGIHPETGEKLTWMYYDDYIKIN